VYRIGEFSKMCRVPVSALRYYGDLGLLPPAAVDTETNYRYYQASQLPRLNRILALKDLGLSLDEIATILDNALSAAELRGMLRLKRAELNQTLTEQQAMLDRVEHRLRMIEREDAMPEYEVVLKEMEDQHVLALRETVHEPGHIGMMIGDGFSALIPAGIMPQGACFALYHDAEFQPENIDVEIAYPVAPGVTEGPVTPAGRSFTAREVPGGSMAVTAHHGPYDTIDRAYAALATWIETNHCTIAGPPQEVYLTAPDDPSGPVTEIRFPVS
jgi:DNA-binding transcriptional MerR regulator